MTIQGIVLTEKTNTGIYKIPTISPEHMEKLAYRNATIVPGDIDLDNPSRFLEFLRNISHRNLKNRIVHPAVLAERHNYNHPRYLISGLPGSGNIIVQTLCLELTKNRKASNFNTTDQEMIALASAYFRSLELLINNEIKRAGRAFCHALAWETAFGAMGIGPEGGDPTWQIVGLPFRPHLWSLDLTFSHEAPSERALQYFKDNGISFISLVRHPLDTIVSIAGKIAHASRINEPALLLHNPEWFHSMVDAVCRHYQAILDNKSRIELFYYEDLLADPVSYLCRMRDILGAPSSEGFMKQLWERFGMKPLPTVQTVRGEHFWKPGSGKWRTYMNSMQKDILRQSRLPELSTGLGYQLDYMDGNYVSSRKIDELSRDEKVSLAFQDCIYSYLLPKKRSFSNENILCLSSDTHDIVAFGYEIEKLALSSPLDHLLNSDLFQRVIASATWPDNASLSPLYTLGE